MQVLLTRKGSAITAARTAPTAVSIASTPITRARARIAPAAAAALAAGSIAKTSATAWAVASAAATPLALVLALPGKRIRTDIPERGFHRIGLGRRTARSTVTTIVALLGRALAGYTRTCLREAGSGACAA